MATKCIATLKNGTPCKYNKKIGNYCGIHIKSNQEISNDQLPQQQVEEIPIIPKKDLILDKYNSHDIIKKINLIKHWWCQKLWKKLYGPCLYKRSLSYNQDELSTCVDIIDIELEHFISFCQKGKYYSFDIRSLHKMIEIIDKDNNDKKPEQNKELLKNPYTMTEIPSEILHIIRLRIAIEKRRGNLEFEKLVLSPTAKQEQDIFEIFQDINKLGNYTDSKWFNNLDLKGLYNLYAIAKDIWEYSYQGTKQDRIKIAQPDGRVFIDSVIVIKHIKSVQLARNYLLHDIRKLVSSGVSRDDKSMGCWLFLSALAKVSSDAAQAMPHLAAQIDSNIYY